MPSETNKEPRAATKQEVAGIDIGAVRTTLKENRAFTERNRGKLIYAANADAYLEILDEVEAELQRLEEQAEPLTNFDGVLRTMPETRELVEQMNEAYKKEQSAFTGLILNAMP